MCPAMGNGKACERSGTRRARMGDYMESLKNQAPYYTSLKIKYAESQVRMFPSLIGLPGEKSSEQELEKLWSMQEGEGVDESNIAEDRDKIISEQKKQIETLLKNQNDSTSYQLNMEEMKAENENLKKSLKTYEKKLIFTRNVTEQKLLENISNPDFYRDDPHLVNVYTATLNEDEFEFEEASDDHKEELENSKSEDNLRSRKDKFLTGVENNLDKSNPQHSVQIERLAHIKNQVIERVKTTKINKFRSRTSSSNSGAKRRLYLNMTDLDPSERNSSRPRTTSPTNQL